MSKPQKLKKAGWVEIYHNAYNNMKGFEKADLRLEYNADTGSDIFCLWQLNNNILPHEVIVMSSTVYKHASYYFTPVAYHNSDIMKNKHDFFKIVMKSQNADHAKMLVEQYLLAQKLKAL